MSKLLIAINLERGMGRATAVAQVVLMFEQE